MITVYMVLSAIFLVLVAIVFVVALIITVGTHNLGRAVRDTIIFFVVVCGVALMAWLFGVAMDQVTEMVRILRGH